MIELYYKIYKLIFTKILNRKIIFNYNKYCSKKIGNALLYYKIEPFLNPAAVKKYNQPNLREILKIVKILNKLGYITDIADRSLEKQDLVKLKPHYDLFIGLGAGNSGKLFADIAKKYPNAKKILYAAGPEPKLSNELIIERYKYFEKRHSGAKLKLLRMITKFSFDDFVKHADSLFVIGNEFSLNSYAKFNKPTFPVYPSTLESIKSKTNIEEYQKKNFLYFGGNGNVVKGLDLLIEVFSETPNLNLYICAPKTETDFNEFYSKTLEKSKNIHFIGFIQPGSNKFNELTEKCAFVILPSCSEGIATSVTTCMRRALIPIVTYEAGIDIGDFGFLIKDINIDNLKQQIISISNINKENLIERAQKSYKESKKYTIQSFSESFKFGIINSIT